VLNAVKTKISVHEKMFKAKPQDEQRKLIDETLSIFAIPSHDQVSANCPACGGRGHITGKRFKELPEQYADGQLYMDVEYISANFLCKACDLSLDSIEEM
jgi:hypothetical protein